MTITCIKNLDKFPCIKQSTPLWCIPASVENVIKYHSGDISQVEIVIEFIQEYMDFKSICFEKVKKLWIKYMEKVLITL